MDTIHKTALAKGVVQIQDFTQVKSVGLSDQQASGFVYSLADLQNLLTGGTIRAYYKFGAAGALISDETGTYDLVNVNSVTNTPGLLNTNFGANFVAASFQHFTQATLLDSISTLFTNGIFVGMWILANDGQPAAIQTLFHKENVNASDEMIIRLLTTGEISVSTEQAAAGAIDMVSGKIMPDGNTPITFLGFNWDTSNGKRLWVNKNKDAHDSSAGAKTLMGDGVANNLFVGALNTPANYWDGKIIQLVVADMVATQRDIDLFNSVVIPIPAGLQGQLFDVSARKQHLGDSDYERDVMFEEVRRDSTRIFRQGNSIQYDSTELIKVYGLLR